MKKTYKSPVTEIVVSSMQPLLNGVSGEGMGYGGVDEGGTKDPSSRRRRHWDDDEDEEE